MGMIYKRGNIYWIKYYRGGRSFFESAKSNKKGDAQRLLAKREGEKAEGKNPGVIYDKIRFNDLTDALLIDYKVNNRKSLWRAEISVKHLTGFFDGTRAPEINKSLIDKYIAQRQEEGAKNATINRELAALKRALTLGHQSGKVGIMPYVSKLKENNVRTGFFEYSEYIELLDNLPPFLQGVLTIGYKYGLRKSEIMGLTWDQVNLKDRILRLEPGETKNEEAREVWLDDEALRLFEKQKAASKEAGVILPWIFLNKDRTGPIKDIRVSWKVACVKGNISGRLFHDLRRTAVRNMVRSGIPEKVAMRISGHKTRSVFDRYNIVNGADLKEASIKIQQYQAEQADGYKKVTISSLTENRRTIEKASK